MSIPAVSRKGFIVFLFLLLIFAFPSASFADSPSVCVINPIPVDDAYGSDDANVFIQPFTVSSICEVTDIGLPDYISAGSPSGSVEILNSGYNQIIACDPTLGAGFGDWGTTTVSNVLDCATVTLYPGQTYYVGIPNVGGTAGVDIYGIGHSAGINGAFGPAINQDLSELGASLIFEIDGNIIPATSSPSSFSDGSTTPEQLSSVGQVMFFAFILFFLGVGLTLWIFKHLT